VIGSGLDVIYPPENMELFKSVANAGAVLSEYPPGMPPIPAHFPSRNRILSGLSLGVAVIEAPKRSGALITAARALEQGRDVFALPGNVDARSCEGSNALLREGAIMIRGAEDIISEYIDLFPDIISPGLIDNEPKTEYIDVDKILSLLDGDEHTVASALIKAPLHVDEISA
jgi:DNA processing protein